MNFAQCILLQQKGFQAYKRGDIFTAIDLTLQARDLLDDQQARKELEERITAWEDELYGADAK